MRNVKVMNIPVGVLAAWILVLGYILWAVEAVVAKPAQGKQPCQVPMVERSAPVSQQPQPPADGLRCNS